jgi:CRISPR-associated protein Cmr3
MTTYRWFTLEPRDRLVVRDGRPLASGTMRTLPFPLPPTLAGVVRTRLGLDAHGRFDSRRIQELLERVSVAGPVLARLDADGTRVEDVLVPAPSDLVFFGESGHRLVPKALGSAFPGVTSDLEGQVPTFEKEPPEGKPSRSPKSFWSFKAFLPWLTRPTAEWASPDGAGALEVERRVHVSIAAATQTAEDGALFVTEGLRLLLREEEGKGWSRLALLAGVSGGNALARGLVPLGGERSMALLENRPAPAGFEVPSEVSSLRTGAVARILLLTPALFAEGALPDRIAGAKVMSACVGRPQVVSGWDFAYVEDKGGRRVRGRPKPTRRMVPAGSVYWVEVPDDPWAAKTWMTCVSSSDAGQQDARDGFGLAVVGVP